MDNTDLSPVSALRLNFDQLPAETTDPIPEKSVFGVPIVQFVPQSVMSWLDGNNSNIIESNINLIGGLPANAKTIGGCNKPNNIITRKVWFYLSNPLDFDNLCD